MTSLSALRRRQGVVRAFITKLDSRLSILEASLDQEEVKCLSTRLNTLDNEFKTHHYEVISASDEDDNAAQADEQAIIDKHDENVRFIASNFNIPSNVNDYFSTSEKH